MPIIKDITPQTDANGNTIIGAPVNSGAASINFAARNCTVIFGEGVNFFGGINFQKDGGVVRVGSNSTLRAVIGIGEGCEVVFGEKTACAGPIEVVAYDGSKVTVGDDCLFAGGSQLRGWDQHPIYDLRTGKRTNYGRDIIVGSRVWMAKDAVALAGSVVGDGSIIGMRSMVTAGRPIPPHCIAVGQPAKVVKKYVAWAKGPAVPDLPNWDSYPDPTTLPYYVGPDEAPSSPRLTRTFTSTLGTVLTALRR